MIGVSLGQYGECAAPIKLEAVPENPTVRLRRMHRACLVEHQRLIRQSHKTVSNAFRNKDKMGILGGYLCGCHPAVSRALAQIQQDIPHRTVTAIYQFVVLMRGQLEVHTANHVLAGYRIELFPDIKLHPQRSAHAFVVGLYERATSVVNPLWPQQKTTREQFFQDNHEQILKIHAEISLDLACCKFHHLFGERGLHTDPERVVHHIVGVGQIAADAVVTH